MRAMRQLLRREQQSPPRIEARTGCAGLDVAACSGSPSAKSCTPGSCATSARRRARDVHEGFGAADLGELDAARAARRLPVARRQREARARACPARCRVRLRIQRSGQAARSAAARHRRAPPALRPESTRGRNHVHRRIAEGARGASVAGRRNTSSVGPYCSSAPASSTRCGRRAAAPPAARSSRRRRSCRRSANSCVQLRRAAPRAACSRD